MPETARDGTKLQEAVAHRVRLLSPRDAHEPSQLKRHVDAICHWLDRRFTGDEAACLKNVEDHCVAYGLGVARTLKGRKEHVLERAWPGAVTWLIHEIHAAVRHGMLLPLKLIPDLRDALIGESEIAMDLFHWLMFPSSEGELGMGETMNVVAFRNCAEVRSPIGISRAVMPGQRRSMRLKEGNVRITAPDEHDGIRWHPGSFLIVRAGDFGRAAVRLYEPDSQSVTELRLEAHQFASVHSERYCSFEDLSCTCGRDTCAEKHRISAFASSDLPHKATLRSFVHSAVRGPLATPKPKSFAEGMLYAWLANRHGREALREVLLLQALTTQNDRGELRQRHDAEERIVMAADGVPIRRWRCGDCKSLEPGKEAACGFCDSAAYGSHPVVAWKHTGGPRMRDLGKFEPFLPDGGADPERILIEREDPMFDVDWEGFANDDQA